ncbi:hypothetical protein MNEG_5889 [Monoraphidium neglectum]|uniref:Uncharacterized protein n=1 Tax=Monoraphidium neglectum TaxID=145388 RepID=A0A0D2L4N9_9CHLO|nr:hypothetical protein MNEG_5889 [Monoraphidium neglectum]KIZ02064.1 hypothetical protein MNEG_5889 [Monoraphidium neglectum]|eukprot:XP_013901083.1 hypothetical protein MNEG_5889 [Monoraphidium neglectum]
MFLERISSNGATSSSTSGSGGGADAGGGPAGHARSTRHERHLTRRQDVRSGRRGGGGLGGFPGQPGLHSDEEEEFEAGLAAGAWDGTAAGLPRRGAGGGRQRHAPTPAPPSSQDAFLDAFINRLLSPQHEWLHRPPGAAGLAPPPPETREGDDALTPAALEAVPSMDVGAGALLFADLARAGKLRAALQLLEAALSAGRDDLVCCRPAPRTRARTTSRCMRARRAGTWTPRPASRR